MPPKQRCRVVTGLIDGDVVGVGALVYMPGGSACLVSAIKPEIEGRRFLLHRAALKCMRWAREEGLEHLYALQDENFETSPRWLTRLGFVYEGKNGKWRVWKWQKPQ